jgi:hypothetical protein
VRPLKIETIEENKVGGYNKTKKKPILFFFTFSFLSILRVCG